MLSITRSFRFDSCHRVLGHQGKCRYIHGHSYSALVTVTAPDLNDLGMVIDFAEVKTTVGNWIDTYWDHNAILNCGDPLLTIDPNDSVWQGKTAYIMKENPTAENMAIELFQMIEPLLPNVTVQQVVMFETPACFATVDRSYINAIRQKGLHLVAY